jgi:pimeloyl-ACP methyl ester carboxylesterase
MPDVKTLDSTIHYQESGSGTPFVFLHGNPSSSHLWREVLPRVGPGRLLAPDLIGMGRSGKPDIAYAFDDHARYLDDWFDVAGLDHVVLVGHDWGGALAFDWAARHPASALGRSGHAGTSTRLPPTVAWRSRRLRTSGRETGTDKVTRTRTAAPASGHVYPNSLVSTGPSAYPRGMAPSETSQS